MSRQPFAMIPHGVAFSAITPGAKELYTFIVARCGNKGECRWTQAALARALRCSVRTIHRRLKELTPEDQPLIVSMRKGSTANIYSLPDALPKQMELPPSGRSVRPSASDHIYRTEKHSPEKAKPAVPAEFSQAQLEHPRVQAALRKARWRIEQAENPRAYTAAIVRGELEPGIASKRQEYGAQRDAATGQGRPHETPCRPLAIERPALRHKLDPVLLETISEKTVTRMPPAAETSGAAEMALLIADLARMKRMA